MLFDDYAAAIRKIGREVNPAALVATRNLVTPLLGTSTPAEVNIVRDVQYGSDARQRLDIFTPGSTPDSGDHTHRPLLVFVHGGGFIAGDKYTPGTPYYDNIAVWAVRNGCNAVNITYRLAPQHQWPSGIEDLHAVMQCLRGRAAEFGIGANNIFLMGQSAGAAHAAAYVAHPEIYAPAGHGLSGLILLSGLYNFAGKTGPLEQAYLGEDTTLYAARSSLAGLIASELPMLLTLAENDPPFFEEQGLELLQALQRKRQHLPRFVHMIGQNHLSVALYLGLTGDLLAPQLLAFIRDNSAAPC